MKKSSKIFIAGHKGMVGSAIHRELKRKKYKNIITAERNTLDLLDQNQVDYFFKKNKPDFVFLAAAKVGGIQANIENPADFLYENLTIQNNIFNCCRKYKIEKILFLGSSCIYPTKCKQPMKEEYLLSGPLEKTNEGYAIAKIAGLKMGEYFNKQYGLKTVSIMPCNLYGDNDNFDLSKSHVMSALIKKFTDAKAYSKKEVVLWGTGKARREFMHVKDLAEIAVKIMEKYEQNEFINVGTGHDITIKNLAKIIAEETKYTGKIKWDKTKPDGMMRKCLDVKKMKKLGLKPKIDIRSGIKKLIKEYKNKNYDSTYN